MFVETFWALARQSNWEPLPAVTQLSVTFSESPSWLPECIPLTLFLVMLQLVTNLEPRKLCSWFVCALRVSCVNDHAFRLCPGVRVRLLALDLKWLYCCSGFPCVGYALWSCVYPWASCEQHYTFLIVGVTSSHCNEVCSCIPSSAIWIVVCLYNVTVVSWLQKWPKTAQIILNYYKVISLACFFYFLSSENCMVPI